MENTGDKKTQAITFDIPTKDKMVSCSIFSADKKYIDSVKVEYLGGTQAAVVNAALDKIRKPQLPTVVEMTDHDKIDWFWKETTDEQKYNFVFYNRSLLQYKTIRGMLDANTILFDPTSEFLKDVRAKIGQIAPALIPGGPDTEKNWQDLITVSVLFTINNIEKAKEWKTQSKA